MSKPGEFSNVPEPPSSRAIGKSASRAIAELDRLLALPSGHPGVLRALGADEPVPVPLSALEYLRRTPQDG